MRLVAVLIYSTPRVYDVVGERTPSSNSGSEDELISDHQTRCHDPTLDLGTDPAVLRDWAVGAESIGFEEIFISGARRRD